MMDAPAHPFVHPSHHPLRLRAPLRPVLLLTPTPHSFAQAEYIFIDAEGDVRSKCRTVASNKATVDQLPSWNYDGSSTEQAPGEDSEVIMKPKAVFKDPFRGGDNILVLTDTYVRARDGAK